MLPLPLKLLGLSPAVALTCLPFRATGEQHDVRSTFAEAPQQTSPASAKTLTLDVAADGSAKFRRVQDAVNAVPKRSPGASATRYVIRIRHGIYREKLVIPRDIAPITLAGDSAATTVLTFAECADTPKPDGGKIGTFASASTTVLGNDFVAEQITFQNSHGAGSQAVAIHVAGDRAVFRNCRFLGWQDTMLLREGRHYFEKCFIEGHVDFIFGGATAFFDRCQIHCLGKGFITAASTPEQQRHGFVFSKCRVSAEENSAIYLGRPWRPHASVVFLDTHLPEKIRQEGWHNWDDPTREQTARFAEYGNRGAGGDVERRVPWSRQLSEIEAKELTLSAVLGGDDQWVPRSVPSPARDILSATGPLSEQRINALPEVERQPWLTYWQRSTECLAADKAVLAAELQSATLTEALPPPKGEDFKLPARSDEWFASEEAQELARIALSFQTPSGGWSKAVAYNKGPRQPGMHWSSQASSASWHYVGTFDNRSTTEQMRLLAKVYQATGKNEFRDGFLKALDHLLAAQFPNGGWPQVYPLEGGYHDAITFNDETMIRIMELLQEILKPGPEFAFVESRERVKEAFEKGITCLLKTQLLQDGRRTAWCAQHDPLTLAPVPARLKEPASLSGSESVGIVRFLMRLPEPSGEVVHAVEDALVWFDKVKLTGLKPVKREGRSFWEHDPAATQPVWARFYDLVTNQPIFAGAQDGIIYDSFEAMWRNNRFGYDFYTDRPQSLAKEESKWRKGMTKSE